MSPPTETLLVVDDDPKYRVAVSSWLNRDFNIVTADSLPAAKSMLSRSIAVVLCDLRLGPGTNEDGLRVLQAVKEELEDVPVVMMTAYGDIDVAVDAMKRGAADFIQKGEVDAREIRKALRAAIDRAHLTRRVASLEEDLRRLEPWELVGEHASIMQMRDIVDMVAHDGFSSALIRGETGTGKELVARAIHSRGKRAQGPFVGVSIAGLPRELIEAELFGAVRGAYTGATESRVGYLEKANGGVLFLDEIGELAADAQVKLLRVLEERAVTRIGTTEARPLDIQLVCATHRDLSELVADGRLRQDLYYRIKTVEIAVPPLRDRASDIPLLADHFLYLFRQQGRTAVAGIAPDALRKLAMFGFPGNVRQLKTIIEWAMLVAKTAKHLLIELADLPAELQLLTTAPQPTSTATHPAFAPGQPIDLDRELGRAELHFIENALLATGGRKMDAWPLLGLNDRYALRRRVLTLFDRYPTLTEEFAYLQRLYAGREDSSDSPGEVDVKQTA